MAIHMQRHTYVPEQPLTAWVHVIARYKLSDLLRCRVRVEGLLEPLLDNLAMATASDADAAEARHDQIAAAAVAAPAAGAGDDELEGSSAPRPPRQPECPRSPPGLFCTAP